MEEKRYTLPRREVPILAEVDVVVVGGGFPGVCAAVAAARTGAKVGLIERDGLLGGQASVIYTFGLCSIVDETGRQFVKGIPWEILQRTIAEGQSDILWELVDYERMDREGMAAEMGRFGFSLSNRNNTTINPNAFRHVLQVMLDEEGVTTFLESPLSDVLLEGNRLKGIVAQGCYGPFAIEAKVVVDTTPQAKAAALAGRPFPYPQAYTGMNARVAGVDMHRLLGYVEANPGDVVIAGVEEEERSDPQIIAKLLEKGMNLRMDGFNKAWQRAVADDPAYERIPPRLRFYCERADGCGSIGIGALNWKHIRLDDPLELSRMIAEFRKNQWLTHKLFREYVPGFEKAHLMDVQPHIARSLVTSKEPGGFTECDVPWEHIERDDDLHADSIVRVMGHHGVGQATHGWQLPYRSLIPKGLEGLLVTGKPACRFLHIHSTNAAVGQAAGVAAAVAAKEGTPLRQLDVSRVQKELEGQGAVVF